MLLELGDTNHQVNYTMDDGLTKFGYFHIGDEEYSISFSGEEKDPISQARTVEVTFSDESITDSSKEYDNTNKNKNQFQVLSTVANELVKYIKQHKPQKITAIANGHETSKNKVYARAFKKLAKRMGFHYSMFDRGSMGNEYIISHPDLEYEDERNN